MQRHFDIFALILVCLTFLCSCTQKIDIKVGDKVSSLERYELQFKVNSLSVYKIDKDCVAVISDTDKIQKYAKYSPNRKPETCDGLNLMGNCELKQFLNMKSDEVEKLIGKPHTDIGSGFCIPAYLTSDAYIVCFEIENGSVNGVFKMDLFTNQISEHIKR